MRGNETAPGRLRVARRPFWPSSWKAIAITGLVQTTINFGSTTMALAEGGAGRTSVLVFTMPFWTLLIAWPVLGERVRGLQWVASASPRSAKAIATPAIQ